MMDIYRLRANPACLARDFVTIVLTALVVLSAARTAFADNCVEQPNLQTAQGGHWYYYRQNSPSHRKCWYLHQPRSSAEPSTTDSKPTVEGDTTLSSFLSSLFDARQAGVSSAVTAAAPSAESVAAKKSTAPSYERRWLWRAKQAKLSQVHQPELERGHQQDQFDSAQREALFERFLRWAAQEGQAEQQQERLRDDLQKRAEEAREKLEGLRPSLPQ